MNLRNLASLLLIFLQISKNECSTIVKRQGGSGSSVLDNIIKRITTTQTHNCLVCTPFSCKTSYTIPITNTKCCTECNSPSICFPAGARVSLESRESLTMSQLKPGHRVQTVTSDGKIRFNEVKTFLKKQPTVISMYKSIETSFNKTIRLSVNHLIYARTTSSQKLHPIYADQISIGDEVLIENSKTLTPAKVINVSNSLMQGAYVPLTTEGNVMVDEVLASCYADFGHDLAHFMMTPMQWVSEKIEWIFGDDLGFSVYVSIGRELGLLMLPYMQYFN